MSTNIKRRPNWLDPNTTAENEVLPGYVKWTWNARAVSVAINTLLVMQITYYSTDMLGLDPLLVGGLLLISKIFDGFTDLVVGFIIDKTKTRWGKARPYEIFLIFQWLLTVLMFSTPDLSTGGKAAFVFVMYTLINSICVTFLGSTDAVYMARSIRGERNRVSVLSFNGGMVMVVSILFSILMPQLIAGLGTTKSGWTIIALALGIPLTLIGMLRFVFVKEVVNTASEQVDRPPLKTGLKCVFQNKYIWILAGMSFVVSIISNTGSGVNTYYFKYIMGDIGFATYIGMVTFVTPFVLLFFPVLSRKLGSANLLRGGAALGIIGYALRTIGGTNVVTLLLGTLLGTVAVLPISIMCNIYLIDCMDYGEWKTGVRVEGMLNSVSGFFTKIGSGVSSAMIGLITGLAGYNGSLTVQSASANASIVALFNYVPLILMVALLLLGSFYKLDKELPVIKTELSNRHANKL